MTNADALLTIGSKGELIKQPTSIVGIGSGEGHEAKVNAKGELLVSTTLIAGEITIGNVKIEGSAGHVAEVNAEGELQTNTKTVIAEHTFKGIENFSTEARSGYELLTIIVTGTYTGVTLKVHGTRGGQSFEIKLVSALSTGNATPNATLLTAGANNVIYSGPLAAGFENVVVECTALATGEAVVAVCFGNEPYLPPTLTNVSGVIAVAQEPSGIDPVLIGGVDGTTLMRRLLTDGEGALSVFPFEASHPWYSTALVVNKEAPEKKEETIAGIAGFRFVLTCVSVDADNAETLTEFGNVLVQIVEETSGKILWRGNLKGSTLTKGSSQSINVAANPVAIATTTGKGIIIKIEKAVKGAEGTVTASGYMIKG